MTFFVGLFLGAAIGVLLMALAFAASRADDDADAYLRRIQHTCSDRCRPIQERHYDEYGRAIA